MIRTAGWIVLVLGLVLVVGETVAQAAPPAAPPVSSFAPAKDLESQLDYYLERLGENLVDAATFTENKETVVKDANTLCVIALALGMHDSANKYKASAGALIAASQQLAEAKDFAGASAALKAVKAAVAGGTGGEPPAWKPVASQVALMQQVPLVNTKLKRLVPRRMDKSADEAAGHVAVLAAIAQGSLVDTIVAKNDEQIQQWYQFSAAMRDAAAAVNQAIRAGDKKAAETAMEAMQKSCDDCHLVFHPEEVGK